MGILSGTGILDGTGILFQSGILVPPSFSPLDLSPALWLDASDATTLYDATTGGSLVAADGTIARWEDKSGNGRHMGQSTGVQQPLRKTLIQNGKDVVRFDGANDFMQSLLADNDLTTFTIFSVHLKNTSKTQGILYTGNASSNGLGFLEFSGNRSVLFGGVAFLDDGTFPNSSFELWAARRTGGTTSLNVNGASQALSNPTSTPSPPSGTTIIGTDNGSSNLDGDIAEILMFSTALSDTDRAAVESYLNSKWAIY